MWQEACRNMRTPCFGAHIVGPWASLLRKSLSLVLYHQTLFGALCLSMGPASGLFGTMDLCFGLTHLVHGPVLGPTVRPFLGLFWTKVPTVSGLFLDYFQDISLCIRPLLNHEPSICAFCWAPLSGDFMLEPYVLTMGPAGQGLILDYFWDHKPDLASGSDPLLNHTPLVHSQNNYL